MAHGFIDFLDRRVGYACDVGLSVLGELFCRHK